MDAVTTPGERDETALGNAWARVVRAVDLVQHAFGVRLEALGTSLPFFEVLTLLLAADDHRLPMSRIARDLSMTSGGFTKLADRMARDGLIDRRGSSGDRRVVFAALTDEGLAHARRLDEEYRSFLREEVLDVIAPDELTTMAAIADRLGELTAVADVEVPTFALAPHSVDSPDRRSRDRA